MDLSEDYFMLLSIKIKNIYNELNFNIFKTELIKHKNNYCLNINEFPELGLAVIYSDDNYTKQNTIDDFTNNLVQYTKCIIFDCVTLKPIVSFYNNELVNSNAMQFINDNFDNLQVTKYCGYGKRICLFYFNNKWLICHSKNIYEIDSLDEICILFINQLNQYIDIIDIDNTYIYHFLLKHIMFRKFGYNNFQKQNTYLSLLWICDNNTNLIDDNLLIEPKFDKFIKISEKKIYFSCFDELLLSLDTLNNDCILNKNINYYGYHIKIKINNKYICCFLQSDIYNNLKTFVPQHKNQHINFLELYQYNRLNNILPFLYKYPYDVLRRINSSLKIISKELLNIYHITRKKKNSNLYDILPVIYKKILFNLHNIYVDQKYKNQKLKNYNHDHDDYDDDDDDYHNFFINKKCITIDIVYNYIKNIKNNELLIIFRDRNTLLNNIKNIDIIKDTNIMYPDDIDIKVQTELMFN
jgi:hypothetical protein